MMDGAAADLPHPFKISYHVCTHDASVLGLMRRECKQFGHLASPLLLVANRADFTCCLPDLERAVKDLEADRNTQF